MSAYPTIEIRGHVLAIQPYVPDEALEKFAELQGRFFAPVSAIIEAGLPQLMNPVVDADGNTSFSVTTEMLAKIREDMVDFSRKLTAAEVKFLRNLLVTEKNITIKPANSENDTFVPLTVGMVNQHLKAVDLITIFLAVIKENFADFLEYFMNLFGMARVQT